MTEPIRVGVQALVAQSLHHWLLIVMVMAFAVTGRCGDATEPTASPRLRRVFVPHEDLPLLGNEYVPIRMSELERLLDSHPTRSSLIPPEPVFLEESTWVAELDGIDLVSPVSRMTISAPRDVPRTLSLAPFAFAINRLDEAIVPTLPVRAGYKSMAEGYRFDTQGYPIARVEGSTDAWLSWSLRGQLDEGTGRIRFKAEIPRCVNQRLFLNLAPTWSVRGQDCVARPIEHADELLGEMWPLVESRLTDEPTQWWVVELSGLRELTLELTPSQDQTRLERDRLVLRERSEYRLRESGLELISEFVCLIGFREGRILSPFTSIRG